MHCDCAPGRPDADIGGHQGSQTSGCIRNSRNGRQAGRGRKWQGQLQSATAAGLKAEDLGINIISTCTWRFKR